MLTIQNLSVSIAEKEILHGVDLQVGAGEIHVIMGPNGGGKSTLSYALSGHPSYSIQDGKVLMDDQDLLTMTPDERARKGFFLAFQYPVEIPGVSVQNFLRVAYEAKFGKLKSILEFRELLAKKAERLGISKSFLERGLNEGFSGGEKKRIEILQMDVLKPKYAVLDETDSGLDIDAIKAVAKGVKEIVKKHNTGIIVITHYKRILKYLKPNVVHIMMDGKIIRTGDISLVNQLEKQGYEIMKDEKHERS